MADNDMDITYVSEMMRTMYNFSLNNQFTNFKIRVGEKTAHVHQSVICSKSDFFQEICLSGDTQVALNNVEGEYEDTLSAVVKFLYFGQTTITTENVVSLALSADLIKNQELKTQCEAYMMNNLTLTKLKSYADVAQRTGLQSLKDECLRFSKEHFSEVSQSEWFTCLSLVEVEGYLQADELNAPDEYDVLQAVVRWLEHSRDTPALKESYMVRLFPCIRLSFCNRAQLDALRKEAKISKILKLGLLEYLHEGMHTDHTPRRYTEIPAPETGVRKAAAVLTVKPKTTPPAPGPSRETDSPAAGPSRETNPPAAGPSRGTGTPAAGPSRETDPPAAGPSRGTDTPAAGPSRETNPPAAGPSRVTGTPAAGPSREADTPAGKTRTTRTRAEAATPTGKTRAIPPANPQPPALPTATPETSSTAHPVERTEDKVIIVGGFKAGGITHNNIICLEKHPGDHTKSLAQLPSYNFSLVATADALFVSGGQDFTTQTSVSHVCKYCYATRSWITLPDMLKPVSLHGSACVDQKLYTIAGCYVEKNTIMKYCNEINVLDLASMKWSECKQKVNAVSSPGIAVVDECIFVIAGFTGKQRSAELHKYNTRDDTLQRCQRMPKTAYCYTRTVEMNRHIYVLNHDVLLRYAVDQDVWMELTRPMKPSYACSMVLHEGRLLVTGGYEKNNKELNDIVQVYDVEQNTWSMEKYTMPLPLLFHWLVVVKLPTTE